MMCLGVLNERLKRCPPAKLACKLSMENRRKNTIACNFSSTLSELPYQYYFLLRISCGVIHIKSFQDFFCVHPLSIIFRHSSRNKNTYFIQKIKRKSHQQLTENIGRWSDNSGNNQNDNNRMFSVFTQKFRTNQSDF